MALSQSFSVSYLEGSSTTLYVNDDTGEYDAVSTIGGYGAPNTARADIALILIAKYKGSAADTDLETYIQTYDPEDAYQFTIIYQNASGVTTDGYLQFNLYTVARKTGSETPATNDFVYDFTTNALQRWNGAAWVAAENSELEDNDIAITQTLDWPHIPRLQMACNYLNKLILDGTRSAKPTDLKAWIFDSEVVKKGVIAKFGEEAYTSAQIDIERYSSRVEAILDLE